MSKQEICYVKQAVQSTRDWDVYQLILRKIFKMMVVESQVSSVMKTIIVVLSFCTFLSFGQETQAMSRTIQQNPVISSYLSVL